MASLIDSEIRFKERKGNQQVKDNAKSRTLLPSWALYMGTTRFLFAVPIAPSWLASCPMCAGEKVPKIRQQEGQVFAMLVDIQGQ